MKPSQLIGIIALLIIVPQASCQKQNQNEEIHTQLSKLLSTYADWGFSGTVLVARGSDIIFEEGYGYANRATGELNTADTRYDFASVAKTFTGAAVLALETDGVFDVQDRLENYMGEFPDERKSEATFHHLATHMAGLAHRSQSQLDYGPDRTAYIESMRTAPFETPPGSSYRYSNAGSSFLAALAEEISEIPHESFVRTRFIEPLGLNTARFIPETEFGEPGIALGYVDDSETPAPSIYAGGWDWGLIGATGITATVGDMYRWFDAVYHGDVLSSEQKTKAFDESEEEAYGWHTDRDEEGRLRIHKGGGLPAMQAQIRAYPEEGITIVWAHNNMTRNWRRALNEGITAVALGDPFGPIPELDNSSKLDSRSTPNAGVYTTDEETMLELSIENGTLILGRNGLGVAPGKLRAQLNQGWLLFNPEDVSWLSVSQLGDDKLVVKLEPNGQTFNLTRTDQPMATMLSEPDSELLIRARGYAEALFEGNTEAVWRESLYRPIQGTNSLEDWNRRARFLSANVGAENKLIEEEWALREGSWRYWRSFESTSGAQAMVRFQLTENGQIAGFGMNPIQGAPEADEKRIISTP